jgi:hypothetical protein
MPEPTRKAGRISLLAVLTAVILVTRSNAQLLDAPPRAFSDIAPNGLFARGAEHQPLASRIFCSSTQIRSRCQLPGYAYGHDNPRHFASVVAFALPVDVTSETLLSTYDLDAQRSVAPGDIYAVSRKKFHFPASSLDVENVSLSQVGLFLYQSGQIVATGRIFHNGGPFGDVLGNRVTIRVRAYAGPQEMGVPFADAPMLWQWDHDMWARRGASQLISFAPDYPEPLLRRHFNEITHIEVELEYRNDR